MGEALNQQKTRRCEGYVQNELVALCLPPPPEAVASTCQRYRVLPHEGIRILKIEGLTERPDREKSRQLNSGERWKPVGCRHSYIAGVDWVRLRLQPGESHVSEPGKIRKVRRERVDVRQREHVVRRSERCAPAGNSRTERRERLIRVVIRVKEPPGQLVPIGELLIDIYAVLIFLIVARERVCGLADTARQNRLRRGDREASIRQFCIQKSEGHRIDVRSVRRYGDSAECSRLSSKDSA